MIITRRNVLVATAAAVTTGGIIVPLGMKAANVKAALARDPVIALSDQVRASWDAWDSADDVHEDACVRVGISFFETREVNREHGIESLFQDAKDQEAQFWDLQARLLDTRATTTRGVLSKIRAFYGDLEMPDILAGGFPPHPLEGEFTTSICVDLERLAQEFGS